MKQRHLFPFDMQVVRNKEDGLGLSKDAIESFSKDEIYKMIIESLKESVGLGILPRKIKVIGYVEVEGEK